MDNPRAFPQVIITEITDFISTLLGVYWWQLPRERHRFPGPYLDCHKGRSSHLSAKKSDDPGACVCNPWTRFCDFQVFLQP